MTLAVALVGAGAIAGVHLTALRRVATVEVVGIFDQDQARARERATCLFGDRKVVQMTRRAAYEANASGRVVDLS